MRRSASLLVLLAILPLHAELRRCTPDQLQDRLRSLESLVSACSAAPGKATCKADAVGDNLQVTLPSGARTVEFSWLRDALARAATGKHAQQEMAAAQQRLASDLSSLNSAAAPPGEYLQRDHAVLREILASSRFPQAQPPNLWQRLRDRFLAWLSSKLDRLGTGGSPTRWISQILLMAVILGSCGGLLLWFSRATRRQRLLLAQGRERTPSAATLLRDWQLWLAEAGLLAEQKQWREAIHHLYWAAIGSMETRGTWRPDRARTPREYLGLLAPGSGSKDDLLCLTRCLERFWYGADSPGERDYDEARTVTERLVA
jgi:hypothetical protein